jgi:prophage tail gpP-like protein
VRAFTRAQASGSWVERGLLLDAWNVTDTVNERSTANVTLYDSTGLLSFDRGQGIKLELDDGTVLFSGYIIRASESRLGLGGGRTHDLECVDQHYLADKRIVADAYTNATSGAIVQAIITDYLAAEGVTAGSISAGETISAVTYNYRTVSDCLDQLAERNGYWWAINADKTLDFGPPGAADGGGIYVDSTLVTSALADQISITRGNVSYRNRQWIRGGRDTTDTQTETQTGDGERRSFLVGFPIAVEPTIEVDTGSGFVAQDVGVAGLQTDRDWYWSYGSVAVTQDSGGAVLSATDRVRVTYKGLYGVVARVQDTTEQAARALVEGGSGIVESVIDDKSLDTRLAAFAVGANLLAVYATAAVKIRFVTESTVFYPGALAEVTLPEAGFAREEALVAAVEWFSAGGRDRAVVTLAIGPVEGTWARYFTNLGNRIGRMAEPGAGEVDVVTTNESLSKTWTEAEIPNIFRVFTPGAGTLPGAATIAAFVPADRVRFMSWYDGATEIGRKEFTSQSGADTSEITTITVLGVNDAVGTFTHLGWWGGVAATSALGSGVEVDRQAFALVKTNVENIQVTKTDSEWV